MHEGIMRDHVIAPNPLVERAAAKTNDLLKMEKRSPQQQRTLTSSHPAASRNLLSSTMVDMVVEQLLLDDLMLEREKVGGRG